MSIISQGKKFLKRAMRDAHEIIFTDEYVQQHSSKVAQILLAQQYKTMCALRVPLPSFEEVEFRAFSQQGEDGILLYLFSVLGTTNKKCVEMCCEDGIECNTANLLINHGWQGLLFDGRGEKVKRGRAFYARCSDTNGWPPKIVHAWITAENCNELIREHGFAGDIDLLSLDMDGVDYWVLKALECVTPRVMVVENNPRLGPDVSVTVPYSPDFVARYEGEPHRNYYGASLLALTNLAKQKGYRLVGCQRYGFNAFFVRAGIGEDILPEIAVADCFKHPYARQSMEVGKHKLVNKEWVEV
ncbi:hypothetical protein EPA93_44695 [Ktedonosporobacter rubrisoli]|uniref:Methyltransferase FkbM domain-containing protein n=1 Tax=Ktedonosporobacter rubrisoli TaxID=2509675 RepID=A0A4P6K438_KTERU|nr:hypothetical protein [Ktedonosporobacter rubrisoli]QBD82693.1 hypothetical protein EPA93_44695 [Ktedonosporobacter rubrisoli]